MELRLGNENIVRVPPNIEIVLCTKSSNKKSTDQDEINGFGLKVSKQTYSKLKFLYFNQLDSIWLLFKPCERLKKFRDDQINDSIFLKNHNVTLAFGSLISPYQFKCADPKYIYEINTLFFAKYHSHISINMKDLRFTLKCDHIDRHRGVIIDIKSKSNIIIHISLRGNLEEYVLQHQEIGFCKRQFHLQDKNNEQCQTCFSTMHLSILAMQNTVESIYKSLCYFIQFFSHHSIPIYFGSIQFSYDDFIYRNNFQIPTKTFICQYAWQMLNSIGCRMHDQLVNNHKVNNYILNLINRDDDKLIYYIMERLRRAALTAEYYFINIPKELPTMVYRYHELYCDSIFHRIDINWINYVRIPWFCFTPTQLIVKPFKFMRSNRVFRYISNISQSMAFVEFRDDTGSAFLSNELTPFLKHYLQNGFQFNKRHYIYLHHAQSQIRNKQFYFYCESEGGMTRKQLETWMGDFDSERIPAKNTARRTQPFSSTEATIEIGKELVDTIPDVKTKDGKYNFTDGVGQISSKLNLLIHEAINVDIEEGDYISSVLQIRYGGCKGTITVNPRLDEEKKQLLIRPSMNKFKCDHQMLELCKRSLKRRLCLNREVINLLSYRGLSSECLLIFQLKNILWLINSLVSNRSALSVLREKVLHVLPWTEIFRHPHLSNEPFFRRLLLTIISNNLHQLINRAHIRVSKARYMFGIVDEYKVLNEGQIFVQITNDDGSRTVLEGPIAITKNPCRHPGDLRVLQAVNNKSLHHLYDVLVFPQQGSRPHASEISGSDLDGDEYTVIWDPKLIPTSINPAPYDYDSGPGPTPLNRVVTRDDRLKVILDICEQDNLGRLSNLHLVLTDRFGIDSKEAISLAGGLSQELDSVKSGQHPYNSEQIKKITLKVGRTRPDFMQAGDYKEYESNQILGKLFRSARHLNDTFLNAFPMTNNSIIVDSKLLHQGYEKYIDFAKELYKKYQYEMLEIIGSYGFLNEIDLFCCVESRNMNANERSDIQQTANELLKEVFRYIRNEFNEDNQSFFEAKAKAKASACYYVSYTDENSKDKRMLSFPWLFSSQLLADYPIISEDDEEGNKNSFDTDFDISRWLRRQAPFMLNRLPPGNNLTSTEVLEICFTNANGSQKEKMIEVAEMITEQLIIFAKTIQSN